MDPKEFQSPCFIELLVCGTKFGELPKDVDMVFSAKGMHNPHRVKGLKYLTGFDKEVMENVRNAPNFKEIVDRIVTGIQASTGKRFVIYCTAGRHRSVVVSNYVARELSQVGCTVRITYQNPELADRSGIWSD